METLTSEKIFQKFLEVNCQNSILYNDLFQEKNFVLKEYNDMCETLILHTTERGYNIFSRALNLINPIDIQVAFVFNGQRFHLLRGIDPPTFQ